MDYTREIYAKERVKAYHARSDKARRWARLVLGLTIATFLWGVWQDRSLSPLMHDGMHALWARLVDFAENPEDIRAAFQQLFHSASGPGGQAEFDPITSWLLKWR